MYTKYISKNPHCKYCKKPWPSKPPPWKKTATSSEHNAANPQHGPAGLELFLDPQTHPKIWDITTNANKKSTSVDMWKHFWAVVRERKQQGGPALSLEELLAKLEEDICDEVHTGVDSGKASKNLGVAKQIALSQHEAREG